MFRKRLALFLSLAMFATSILMPSVNVLAEEEIVTVGEEGESSEKDEEVTNHSIYFDSESIAIDPELRLFDSCTISPSDIVSLPFQKIRMKV